MSLAERGMLSHAFDTLSIPKAGGKASKIKAFKRHEGPSAARFQVRT